MTYIPDTSSQDTKVEKPKRRLSLLVLAAISIVVVVVALAPFFPSGSVVKRRSQNKTSTLPVLKRATLSEIFQCKVKWLPRDGPEFIVQLKAR